MGRVTEHTKRRTQRFILLPVYMLAGSLLGGGVGLRFAWSIPERTEFALALIWVCTCLGLLLGPLVWLLNNRVRNQQQPKSVRGPARLPDSAPPAPYESRLAKFLDRTHDDSLESDD